MSDKIVLSYYDSLIRESDFSLLDAPQWLNDKVIGFYFEYLEKEIFLTEKNDVCFITPDVTQFIKLYKGPELKIFLEPLNLHEKKLIVLAVNNNASSETCGGSHWSTLTYNRELNTFNHYDSSSPSNHQSAKQCAAKLTPFVTGTDTNVPFVEVSCPRQHNTYDCGVYALLFAEHIAKVQLRKLDNSITDIISLEVVSQWRTNTKKLIMDLAQSFSL